MELETRFENVIQDMDKHCFVLELSTLSNPMRSLRDEAKTEKNNKIVELLQHELDALELYPRSFIINSQSYERRMPTFIDEYSQEKLDYYTERFSKTLNSQLKSRYGDILMDYQGKKKINNKYKIFCSLVPHLLQL